MAKEKHIHIYGHSNINYIKIDTSNGTLCKIFVIDFVIFILIFNASKKRFLINI